MQHRSDPHEAPEIVRLHGHVERHGAIMSISGRFCAHGMYWADIIRPGYGTIATGRSPLQAARAAVSQFDRDRAPTGENAGDGHARSGER